MTRLTAQQRAMIEGWLLGADERLYTQRVPLTSLGAFATAETGVKVSNQAVRRILWRLRFRGQIVWYNGRSDSVFGLVGGRP